LDALNTLDALQALRALKARLSLDALHTLIPFVALRAGDQMFKGNGRVSQLSVVALDLAKADNRAVKGRQDIVELNVELVAGLRNGGLLRRVICETVIPFVRRRRLRHE
jgi:hypothetical protein